MTIRYGIISTAQIVPRFVAGVRESVDGEVVAIASRHLEKAQEMAHRLAIPVAYGSYEELYQDESIDIIYIATYNQGHYSAAKAALSSGRNVLLEKPFTLKKVEAEELFSLAEKNNCFLMEAQKSVFLPATVAVKEMLAAGVIGEIRFLRSVTSYPNIDHISWFNSFEAGGGVLHGSGSYPLQYMQFLLNEEIKKATGTAILPEGKTDQQCDISLKFSDQLQGNIFLTVQLDLPNRLIIYGSKGQLEIPTFWRSDQAFLTIDQEVTVYKYPFESEFVFEVDHVNACLTQGLIESPVMTKKLTIDTVGIIEDFYKMWCNEENN